ncbi:MAG: ABC transporter ATP-binding protein [Blastocatellia bacterium]
MSTIADAIVMESVSKSFGEVIAVRDVSFNVRQGEIFGLVGQNGAGKTTVLRMIMDIFRPDAGSIRIFGRPPEETVKEIIGYLPEERGIYVGLKVGKVLEYFARLKGLPRARAKANVEKWLHRFGIEDYACRRIETLSKGNQQKVQLIAALVADPKIVILDEPLAGLDPINTRLLTGVIRNLAEQGTTIIFSSHQMPVVERLCTRVLMIARGEVVLYGPLAEIRQSRNNPDGTLEDIYVRLAREGAGEGLVERVNGER